MTQLYTVYKDLSSKQSDAQAPDYKNNFNKLDLANIKTFSSEKVCAKRLKDLITDREKTLQITYPTKDFA